MANTTTSLESKPLIRCDDVIKRAFPSLVEALRKLDDTVSTKLKRKSVNAINRTVKSIQESLQYDRKETLIWQDIFDSFQSGVSRRSLDTRIREAENLSLIEKNKRILAESEIATANAWLQQFENARASHAAYLKNTGHSPTTPDHSINQSTGSDASNHTINQSIGSDASNHTSNQSTDSDASNHTSNQSTGSDASNHTSNQSTDSDASNHTINQSIGSDGCNQQQLIPDNTSLEEDEELENSPDQHGEIDYDGMNEKYKQWLAMPKFSFEHLSLREVRKISGKDIVDEAIKLGVTTVAKSYPSKALISALGYLRIRHELAVSCCRPEALADISFYHGRKQIVLDAFIVTQISGRNLRDTTAGLFARFKTGMTTSRQTLSSAQSHKPDRVKHGLEPNP